MPRCLDGGCGHGWTRRYIIVELTSAPSFTAEGYTAGHQHGAIHGTIEGRALGRSKGFELWDELAYYDTQARLALLEATTSDKPDRSVIAIPCLTDATARRNMPRCCARSSPRCR